MPPERAAHLRRHGPPRHQTKPGRMSGVEMLQPKAVLSNRPRVNWLASGMGFLLVRAAARGRAQGLRRDDGRMRGWPMKAGSEGRCVDRATGRVLAWKPAGRTAISGQLGPGCARRLPAGACRRDRNAPRSRVCEPRRGSRRTENRLSPAHRLASSTAECRPGP